MVLIKTAVKVLALKKGQRVVIQPFLIRTHITTMCDLKYVVITKPLVCACAVHRPAAAL